MNVFTDSVERRDQLRQPQGGFAVIEWVRTYVPPRRKSADRWADVNPKPVSVAHCCVNERGPRSIGMGQNPNQLLAAVLVMISMMAAGGAFTITRMGQIHSVGEEINTRWMPHLVRLTTLRAKARQAEIHQMLTASFTLLNTDYGFSLQLTPPPAFDRFVREIDSLERNYVQYLGLSRALRLAQPRFMEQFRRMLVSKLRVVFENASGELELWNKAASAQVDSQLRERRRAFRRRREALERIQGAAGELEQRITEFESQDARMQQFQARVGEMLQELREQHCTADFLELDLDLPLPPPAASNDAEVEPVRATVHA